MQIREGLYYNPYFPGGAIAMPKMLADEGAEYDDGTVATESQQAKVSCPYVTANAEICVILTLQPFMDYLSSKVESKASCQQHWDTGT